jgi:protein-S-isoprenylcysteine O-methyltransferase Ste14
MLLPAKNLLFTLLVRGTVAVFVPLYVLPHHTPAVSVRAVVAWVPLLLGASIYAWCLWDFAVTGRGTPVPLDAPKVLVVRGLYRYSRNPMYVGVLSGIAGWALLCGALNVAVYGACVAALFSLFVLFYEEPHLRRVFGARYEQYCSEVSRWFPLDKRRVAS